MILNLLMTARNINEFLTKKRMLREPIRQWHQAQSAAATIIYFNPASVHQCNSIQLNASSERGRQQSAVAEAGAVS